MALFEQAVSRRTISGQLLYFGGWAVITTIAAFLHPSRTGHGTHEQLGLPPCPSVLLFNRPCPGCGLTTSWTAFVHGDLAFAFHAHPLGPFLYLFFTATALLALRGWVTREKFLVDSPKFNRVMLIGAVIFVSFGLVRMAITPNYRTMQDIAALR